MKYAYKIQVSSKYITGLAVKKELSCTLNDDTIYYSSGIGWKPHFSHNFHL